MMKLYVKYSKYWPHLPEAVAESKSELARITGIKLSVVLSSFSHKRGTYAEVEVEDEKEKINI